MSDDNLFTIRLNPSLNAYLMFLMEKYPNMNKTQIVNSIIFNHLYTSFICGTYLNRIKIIDEKDNKLAVLYLKNLTITTK